MVAAEPGAEPAEWMVPSPRLRTLRRAQLASAAVLVLAAVVAAAATTGAVLACGLAAAAVVVAAGVADVVLGRRVRAWGFAERSEDLLVRRGVMFRRQSIIPYGRMQYVDVTAGPYERSLGLATVRMHTAAAASDARIPGLEAADATRLRDRLSALGESHLAGL